MAERSGFMANKQHGKFMEGAHQASKSSAAPGSADHEQGSESQTVIHHHADGTHHVEHADGSKSDSLPTHLHVAAHIAHHLSGGDKHHIVHHDGMSHTTHGIHEDGSHDGPHDHENLESVKSGLDKFFNEEAGEGSDWGQEGEKEHEPDMAGY